MCIRDSNARPSPADAALRAVPPGLRAEAGERWRYSVRSVRFAPRFDRFSVHSGSATWTTALGQQRIKHIS
eukprot:15165451-Alexandrium_andersonii.AAC.1